MERGGGGGVPGRKTDTDSLLLLAEGLGVRREAGSMKG